VPQKYDVLVVGAGIAGSTLAYFLSRKGVKVLLADMRPFARAGDKACGDAMGKHHFDELGVEYPSGEELTGNVKGIDVYSPSEGTKYRVLGDGFMIDRIKFTQRFIRRAVDAGAEYWEKASATKLIVRDNIAQGAILRKGSENIEVYAQLVVDATGYARTLANQVPDDWPIKDPLKPEDAIVAYREVRRLDQEIDEPEILRIYISKRIAPGGYWWFFPYSLKNGLVNVGLGVQHGVGYPNPKDLLYKYVLTRPEFEGSEIVEAGGAPAPTRRPVNTLVWNGLAVIGDAAYAVNPVHGGGKGSAMITSWCLANAYLEANGDTSNVALWSANKCFLEHYGIKQAALDIFRMFLQQLSDDDLEYGMSRKIIKETDLNTVSMKGDLELSVVDKAMRLLAGIGRPSLLLKLRAVAKYMNRAKELYRNYPDRPEDITRWINEVFKLYEEYRTKVLK